MTHLAPPFITGALSEDAARFADDLAALGNERDPVALLGRL